MADRLLKWNQSNFLLSNFCEFYKLWRDNQEATLRVKCCGGKLSINFESSFQSPVTNPTLPAIVKRKAKRISPSRRKRNQARAEQFRRNKDNAEVVPASSKEGQEEMQVSVSSPESAVEKPLPLLAAAVPVDNDTRNLESSSSFSTSFHQEEVKYRQENAENSTPLSRVKRKAKRKKDERKNATVNEPAVAVESSVMSARLEAEANDDCSQDEPELESSEDELQNKPSNKPLITNEFLEGCLDDLRQRFRDTPDDPQIFADFDTTLRYVSKEIKKLDKLISDAHELACVGMMVDEGHRTIVEEQRTFLGSLERKLQGLLNYHKSQRPVHPRGSSVSSYKDRSSARSQKGKKR